MEIHVINHQKLSYACTLIISLITCTLIVTTNVKAKELPREVEEVFIQRENIVKCLAELATELHENRYENILNCECTTFRCANKYPDLKCYPNLDYFPEVCGNNCNYRNINYDKSFLNLPYPLPQTNYSNYMKEEICTYRGMDEEFKKLKTEYNVTTSTYLATKNGIFRKWPITPPKREIDLTQINIPICSTYDPRIRPWYVGASTGPKDVIIIADKSASMLERVGNLGDGANRWSLTQKALISIMDTFSIADFVNVVLFSSDVEVLGDNNTLVSVNEEDIQVIKDKISSIQPSGSTNFLIAFDKAFDLFESTHEFGQTSMCSKIIIFLTDGRDINYKPSEILDYIKNRQLTLKEKTGKETIIFSYSMGSSAIDTLPRQISCENGGAWSKIEDRYDPLTSMNNYYSYLADQKKDVYPTWVDFFLSAGIGGISTGVSIPFYSKSENGRGVFLGVIGHDFEIADMSRFNISTDEIIEYLVKRSKKCEVIEPSSCINQIKRSLSDDAAICPDSLPESKCYQYENYYYSLFEKGKSWQEAQDHCISLNGNLVSIRSKTHHSFISSISSPDGSWIGAKRLPLSSKDEFIWLDPIVPNVDKSYEGWSYGQPDNLDEECLKIDRRGISNNLNDESCNAHLTYICEFNTSNTCEDDILKINNDTYFVHPSVELCEETNNYSFNELNTLDITKNLKNEDVICELGDYVNFYEIACCGTCSNEYNLPNYDYNLGYENNLAIRTNCNVFLVLVLIFIIFYILII